MAHNRHARQSSPPLRSLRPFAVSRPASLPTSTIDRIVADARGGDGSPQEITRLSRRIIHLIGLAAALHCWGFRVSLQLFEARYVR